MIIIGLCGSSGSGKGHVCREFSAHGVAFIDTDRVYREKVLVSADCVNELVEFFGSDILENGAVSKARLAAMVFEGEGAEARLNRLNEITHKYIKIETEALLRKYEREGYGAVLVDAPVLFESGFDKMCHVTLCVTAPLETKVERIMQRDGIVREKALARLSSQMSDEVLRSRCTYEIDNSHGADLASQIKSVLTELKLEENTL